MPTTNITYNRYYPKLNRILPVDKIPDELGEIKTVIIDKLEELYYKDLQINKNSDGSGGYWQLSIVSKRLSLPVFETGFDLVINPDLDDTSISSFKISLEFQMKALAIIRSFQDLNIADIPNNPDILFKLILKALNITEIDLVSNAIFNLVEPVNQNTSHIQQFVNDLNSIRTEDLSVIQTNNKSLQEVLEEIYTITNEYSSVHVFTKYLLGGNTDETFQNIEGFFRGLFPADSVKDYILSLFIPKIELKLHSLSLGLAFPREILLPLDNANTALPAPAQSILTFDIGAFAYSTEYGFDYSKAQNFNLPNSKIGKTDLTISITNLKLDLSDKTNIPEATADERPTSFKGIFIEEAVISFPDIFTSSGNTLSLVTTNMLVGTEGGISGTIGLRSTTPITTTELRLPYETTLTDINFSDANQKLVIKGLKKVLTYQAQNESEEDIISDVAVEEDIEIPEGGLKIIDSENNRFVVQEDGSVSLDSMPQGIFNFSLFGTEIKITDFYLTFNKNKIVSSTVTGTIKPASFDEADPPLDMTIDFTNGFRIHVSAPNGLEVFDNNIFTLTLEDLELGRADEKIFLGITGNVTNNLNIPFVNQFIPQTIAFSPLRWVQTEGFDYQLNLTWSNGLSYGFGTENPPSLEKQSIYFPIIQEKDDGVFKLKGIEMAVEPIDEVDEKGLDASFKFDGASFTFKGLGGVVIDGMGFSTALREADPGDIGPFDVGIDFIPPEGLGLSVDLDAVKGGGYLYFDFDKGRFVGVGKLKVKDKFTIKIIGILLTKLPGNPDGYSFLLMVTVEGMNADLGFGFTLTGVGGLIALHRSMNLQALRDGVRNKTIDNILFPDDPINDIAVIVSDLERVFPVQEGRHTFGLMAQVKWGKPQLITGEIGLMIEVPSPIKIAILGVVKARVPEKGTATMKIQINFVGTIDFEAKYITFDASIFDSRFAKFTLEGDMAFRLKWGDESNFLLSVGGFHPSYTPPPLDLPALRRITINLLGPDNPRLTLSSYFALTSNTVQFGSRVDFYYRINDRWNVMGNLGFDILLQFSPFYLQAELYALLAVLRKGKAVASISLGASIEGPGPWHAQGHAQMTVLGFDVSVNFDKTFGEYNNDTLPDIDVWQRLLDEKEKPENWTTDNLIQTTTFVNFREPGIDEDQIIVDPNGSIIFSQAAVPLGFAIDKYGKQKPANHTLFNIDIEKVVTGGDAFVNEDVKDLFAPAQFIEMTDSQKLVRKSFEKMKAGVKVAGSEDYTTSYFGNFQLEYETVVYDTTDNPQTGPILVENQQAYQHFSANNAVSNSGPGKKQTNDAQLPKVSLSQETYAIANLNDLTIHNHLGSDQTFGSEAEAQLALQDLFINNPALINTVEVVAAYELA